MIANKHGVLMKKSEIVRRLSEKDAESIRTAIEHIQHNEELLRVKRFDDYCKFILQKIIEESKLPTEKARMQYRGAYNEYIKKVKVIIENHGVPRKGHLDDYATQIINLLESEKYRYLLDVYPAVRLSYVKVKNHAHEPKHSIDYERHLNHLNEILSHAEAERSLEARRKIIPDLTQRTVSA